MTLAEALEAALNGQASRQDVIDAITAELEADPEPNTSADAQKWIR